MPTLSDRPPLIRLTDANYADGIGAPAGGTDSVVISANLFDQDGVMPNPEGLSNLFVAWGQFMDHDLSLTLESHGEVITADGLVAPLTRSEYAEGTGDDDPRMPTNAITWQIDASQVYGSSQERTDDLRTFEGGQMRTSEDETSDYGLLPEADPDSFMAGDITSDDPVFLAGDVRANEKPALASLHTLMVREHNYWAARLAEEHPDWTDEQLFDGARQIVEYEMQSVTYNEWLPHLIGDAVGPDTGYDPDVNGQVAVEFSTAGFRFGHTMVSSTIEIQNDDGTTADSGNLSIMNAFFNPDPIKLGGIEGILRGQAATFAQEADTQVVDDLNFFLFTPDGLTGFSLVGLNLLRGQDHGLQSYVDTRAALLGDIDPDTLDPLDFSIITDDPVLQAQLASVYPTVHDVDLWVGGLAEDAVDGTQMGPLFTFIIGDQFTRTRAADETFGELDPALGDGIIAEVKGSTLNDIILRNTEIDSLQDDPFVAASRALEQVGGITGTWFSDVFDLDGLHIDGNVITAQGDDTVTVRGGTRIEGNVHMGQGSDTYLQSSGTVAGSVIVGGATGDGADSVTLTGTARVDADILTGDGNDTVTVTGNAVVDGKIMTGVDDDTITIGGRASVTAVLAGTGNDTITVGHNADVNYIDGGEDDDGNDFYRLQINGGNYRIDWLNGVPDSEDGTVVFLNPDGSETGEHIRFSNIESVTCFTPGIRIITADGMRRIEDIALGDRVYTLDHGLQPVQWIGRTTVLANGPLAPIRIAAGALGNTNAMDVSPQHRFLLSDWRVEMVVGEAEALAAAKHLVNDTTIRHATGGTVDYIHLMFADHEIVMAEGIASESFHPGRQGVGTLPEATRAELLALFPELAGDLNRFGPTARDSVKPHEAKVILSI